MTLENLLAIHRLQAFEATPGGVLRLLASAERNRPKRSSRIPGNGCEAIAPICSPITLNPTLGAVPNVVVALTFCLNKLISQTRLTSDH